MPLGVEQGSRMPRPGIGGLAMFGGLSVAFSWIYWLTVLAGIKGWVPYRVPLSPLGAFGPAVAAVVSAGAYGGRRDVAQLLRRLRLGGITWRGLGLSLAAWPVLVGGALVVAGLAGTSLAPTGALSPGRVLLILSEIFIFTAVGEELGWRGYALPMLLTRYHPVVASLVVGAVWAIWHLPLFWIPGTAQASIPFGYFALTVLASSFIYTAAFLVTRPSVIPVMLLHTTADASLSVAQLGWPRATLADSFWFGYMSLILLTGAVVAFLLWRWPQRSASCGTMGPAT